VQGPLRRVPLSALAIVLACGCATAPDRTFYDDSEGGLGTSTDDGPVLSDSPTASPDGNGGQGDDSGDAQSQGGDDGETGAQPAGDATRDTGPDGGSEDGATESGSMGGPDARAEAGADARSDAGSQGAPDAQTETGPWGGPDAAPDTGQGAPDAQPDTGCGSLDTLQNCGGCGNACGSLNVTSGGARCVASACMYTCAAGYSNCNKSVPNTTGCECHTPNCCMNGRCETTHSAGVANVEYYDCNAPATSSTPQATLINQALAACQAYEIAMGRSGSSCTSGFSCKPSGGRGPYVCNGPGLTCDHCWSYAGIDVLGAEDCGCPGGIYGSWN
jgi:hypothetical protein